MKKFDLKSIFMGVVAGVLATCGVSIAATLVAGDVYFSSYPIYVNGSYYTSTSPILNYNGRTYLPLNELGTVLGSSVKFVNNAIYVNTNNNWNDDNYDELREEDFELEKGESDTYYISLAKYGARSATITGANSYVKVNKTKFTAAGDLKLTGAKVGEATIKITYSTGDVEKLYVEVTEDDEYEYEVNMETGDTYKVYIDLDDYDANEAKITYDSDYVKVSKTKFTSDGYLTITAKKEGDTTVKIKYDSADTEYVYIEIDDDNFDANYDEVEVDVDDYEYVYIDLEDYDATSATLTYNNSYIKLNTTYITESQNIKVTGRDEGYTSIKVKFNTGEIVYIDVEVVD